MSGSYRGVITKARFAIFAALTFAAIALGSVLYFQAYRLGLNDNRAQLERQRYASETPKRVEQECRQSNPDARQECTIKILDAQRESQRSESDLAAQWQAANWAFWAVAIAGAQTLITLVGTILLYRQINLTREALTDTGNATKAMQDANTIAQNTHRPWLKIQGHVLEVETTPTVLRIDWKVACSNIGQMIAESIQIRTKCLYASHDFFDVAAAEVRALMATEPEDRQAVLVPGDETWHKGSAMHVIEFIPWDNREGYREDFHLLLIAVAHYRLPGENNWRVSAQCFVIGELINTVDDCAIIRANLPELTIDKLHVRKIYRSFAT